MKNKSTLLIVFGGLLFALVLAVFASPHASSWPDGLERVAKDLGFIHKAPETGVLKTSPAPDYAAPGAKSESGATRLAAVIGTIAVFAAGWGLAAVIKRKNVSKNQISD